MVLDCGFADQFAGFGNLFFCSAPIFCSAPMHHKKMSLLSDARWENSV